MKHLAKARYVPVAVVSGIAAALAAGAFGLTAASGDDPDPIQLEDRHLEPVALVPTEAATAQDSPASPITQASPGTPQSAPSPVSPASPASPDSPGSPSSPGSPDSPDSPGSGPSPDSVDS